MALKTFSVFYFDLEVTTANNSLNFNEGAGELLASISVSSYTTETMAVALKTALDAAGTLVYTVDFDRDTRKYTISTTAPFDLLIATGTQLGTSIFSLIGFTGADLTGLTTYTGNNVSGDIYFNQFVLQDFKKPSQIKERVAASVNEAASGQLEVISFGLRRFIEFSLKYITDLPMDGKVIKNNPTGEADAERFLTYLSTKGQFEFMADVADRDTFLTLVVETMPGNNQGVGYELDELFAQDLPDYFEILGIRCRVIE